MKTISLLALVALPALAQSPTTRTTTEPLAVTRGAFFAVSVADLDASAKWYAEKLGLTVVMRPPKLEKSAVVVLEGGGLIVELLQRDDAQPLRTAAPSLTADYLVHGIFKAGIVVDDLQKTLATLKARGVRSRWARSRLRPSSARMPSSATMMGTSFNFLGNDDRGWLAASSAQ